MIKLYETGIYLTDGKPVPADEVPHTEEERLAAAKGTISHGILAAHNQSQDLQKLRIRFDAMTSHDITYVGIIQTARASGMEEFPIPYVLTNCHNTLCAVGGTINEDDHRFGLSAAVKYGGIYVPPHLAVIHQYMRERMAGCGRMILGSDSHTRYGALGTMAIGEGGGELSKQLLRDTYDISYPEVIAVYLEGTPAPFVGPQDIALAIIGAVFKNGYVKNKIMEFVGPGIAGMSADYRNGIDVMTTETTCLSSIWQTDEGTREWYRVHGREEDYRPLTPENGAYYDGCVRVDLSAVKPMIALPFHPSNVWPIGELKANLSDILHGVELEAAKVSGGRADFTLTDKIRDGELYVQQGVIAGCAGGTYSNLCEAANVLRGRSCGNGAFTLSVYPASQPVNAALVKNGTVAALIDAGAITRTAFCGPCFGAGDTPSNNGLSVRHTTRNFPNREGSKPGNGQMAAVALMDARSIAATAAAGGKLTSAEAFADCFGSVPPYEYDDRSYRSRVYEGYGHPQPESPLVYGPNIKDWPGLPALSGDVLLRVCARIMDPVTTTDELIPSGETSSYRSNPLGLAEFTLSRREPRYVARAKAVGALETLREQGDQAALLLACPELASVYETIAKLPCAEAYVPSETEIGSMIYAVRPGDGSAREQAASCQRVLGGLANLCEDYATKRYRSNVINWGMLPFRTAMAPDFAVGDWIFVPGVRNALADGASELEAYVLRMEDTSTGARAAADHADVPAQESSAVEGADSAPTRRVSAVGKLSLTLGELTQTEREIIGAGCLINYNRNRLRNR